MSNIDAREDKTKIVYDGLVMLGVDQSTLRLARAS